MKEEKMNYAPPTSDALDVKLEGVVCSSKEGNASDPALAGLPVTSGFSFEDDDD